MQLGSGQRLQRQATQASSASSCGATRDARSRAAKALVGPFPQQYLLQRHFVFPRHAVDLDGAVSVAEGC
ncbi:MAG: hypothetical protein ACPIOQ_58790 [Promethearchaeia archaeon]